MPSQTLSAARAVVSCAVVLALSMGSIAHAQDLSPASSPLCQLLTPKEIKSALKVKVAAGVGSDSDDGQFRSCTWTSSDGSGLAADYGPGTLKDSMYMSYLDGAPQTIDGDKAIMSTAGILGGVEVGDHLLLLRWATLHPATGASLEKLLELATPRLATLSLAPTPTATPTMAPSIAPEPSFDPGLAALFPTVISGAAVVPELTVLPEFLGFSDPSDPASAGPVGDLGDILTAQGRSLDEVTVEGTVVVVGNDGLLLEAMRVPGADMSAMAGQIEPLALTTATDPVATIGQVAGRNMTWYTEGPDSADARRVYLYPANDVLWEVAGPAALATEAIQQLPCAADALAAPSADNGFSCGALPLVTAGASPGTAPAASPATSPEASTAPTGSSTPAVSLASLFPATLGGKPADVQVTKGKAAFQSYSPAFVTSMNDVLVSHGKSLNDLDVALAAFAAKGQVWNVTAYRVPGLDASVTTTLLDPLIAAFYPKMRRTDMTIGGKPVTLVTNGKYSPKGTFTYIYLRDDVAWYVTAVDPDLTQIFTDLP